MASSVSATTLRQNAYQVQEHNAMKNVNFVQKLEREAEVTPHDARCMVKLLIGEAARYDMVRYHEKLCARTKMVARRGWRDAAEDLISVLECTDAPSVIRTIALLNVWSPPSLRPQLHEPLGKTSVEFERQRRMERIVQELSNPGGPRFLNSSDVAKSI